MRARDRAGVHSEGRLEARELMASAADKLNARFAAGDAVRFTERLGGCVAHLRAADHTAVVALQGAQVLSFVPGGLGEVLWLSPLARLGAGKAVRGGIPVCWPWFGPHPHEASKPAHGFVRARNWSVTEVAGDGDEARIALAFVDFDARLEALWPHKAALRIEITLGETLRVALSTLNTGVAPFSLTQALHTYLRVGDIAEVRVEGLEGSPYIDQLQAGRVGRSPWPIVIGAEVDRIYQDSADKVRVRDEADRRVIDITKTGSHSTVVWNPWIEKSARLGDMGEDGYRRMVCVETANADRDVVTLEPGARHTLSLAIRAHRG